MAFNGKLLHPLLVLGVLIILILVAPAASKPNLSCERRCGQVDIPYPFGTSEGCYLDSTFNITCNNISHPRKPSLRPDMFVKNISIVDGELRVSNPVASLCKFANPKACNKHDPYTRCQQGPSSPNSKNSALTISYSGNSALFKLSNFRVSNKRNKITAVGCGVYSFIQGSVEQEGFTTGCLSLCNDHATDVVNGSCSGIGCCQTEIPKGATEFNLSVRSLSDDTKTIGIGECAYGFILEEQAYNFSYSDFKDLKNREDVTLVLDWAVGNEACEDAKKKKDSYACKATNSYCYNSSNGPGYRCNCSDGYHGNPYLPSGPESCQDINECISLPKPCAGNATCNNTDGNYTCTCRHGFEGDGMMPPGIGCRAKESQSRMIPIALGASTCLGILFLLIGGWGSYKVVKKRKRIERRQEFFKRNGGLLLQQQISQSELNVANTKLFNSKDLEKATDHFNDNRILGQGGQGTVYKGMLEDGRIVAVKKSKIINEGKLQEFINEVVVLSRINHRNIVKLLGCCLETEVPLLVYEFVPNGTLSKYLSDQNEEFPPTWDMRLRIATEIAGALYYLHSAASLPIYHRDIKSTNILLDDKYRAKVADFGTSRSVAIDQTHLTTLVHGTFGYLDPEYFQSSQFTQKSDVYSFGVVLVELLTGEKAISLTRTPEAKSLATYFICSMEENNLFDILDRRVLKEAVKEELITVANLAKRCLNLDGKKRPTMQEVSMELEAVKISQKASSLEMCKRDDRPTMTEVAVMLDGLRGKEKQTRKEADLNTEESEYLLSTYPHSLSIDVGVGCSSTSTLDST
ncbi:wall-associated receptor kinase-like 1 [Carya illinoinensis]|uniref:wall-associated receptor kinase-like 1 n=1 Tax=Carya illinoinensis TaxID=32201 RepID=UPI001C71E800|nr:wall-associated receptor kinase-like 1 [Carya illinoinensis]XP_042963780.1 wall-associated receptor kinase-like 1 [Carya illinoinensis]XP_042963781.1 wall-associated receptor kinase-like 1 [Carya illinoinensis]